jgi:hypothetical protein
MIYTTKLWSKLLKKVETYYPRRFFSARQIQTYIHPWTVTMGLDRQGNTTPFFYPGGVNGYPPYVEMPYSQSPFSARRRVQNEPGYDAKSFDARKLIRVYLDEQPTLPLNWRNFDPKEGDKRPHPFSSNPNSPILATDIIIRTQRIALNLNVVKEVSADLTGIQVNPTYSEPSDYGFKIVSVSKYVPPLSYISSADIVAGRFFDNPFEECKICTIYALQNGSPKPIPDMTWLFATSYDAYYNLLFFAPFVPDQTVTERLTFASPLAGGALQAAVILGQLFSANNEFTQAYVDFASRVRKRGTYLAI